jgi:hypothetical protein
VIPLLRVKRHIATISSDQAAKGLAADTGAGIKWTARQTGKRKLSGRCGSPLNTIPPAAAIPSLQNAVRTTSGKAKAEVLKPT